MIIKIMFQVEFYNYNHNNVKHSSQKWKLNENCQNSVLEQRIRNSKLNHLILCLLLCQTQSTSYNVPNLFFLLPTFFLFFFKLLLHLHSILCKFSFLETISLREWKNKSSSILFKLINQNTVNDNQTLSGRKAPNQGQHVRTWANESPWLNDTLLGQFSLKHQNSCHFLNQWEAKPKPAATSTRVFSRAWGRLHVFAFNSDWSLALFWSDVIGWSNCFGISLATLYWKLL